MYSTINFKTKKQFKEAVAAGRKVELYQPGGMFAGPSLHPGAVVTVEGPHYPEPHRWYARVTVGPDGCAIKVV